MSARFGQVPPPVPPAIAYLYPDVVEAQKKAADNLQVVRKKNPMEKVVSVVLVRARWLTIFSAIYFVSRLKTAQAIPKTWHGFSKIEYLITSYALIQPTIN